MMHPKPMIQLSAVVLDPDVDTVTKTLLDAGVIDFIDVRDIAGNAASSLKPFDQAVPIHAVQDLRGRIEGILGEAGIDPALASTLDIFKLDQVDVDKATGVVDRIVERVRTLQEEQRDTRRKLRRLEDMRKQLALFGSVGGGIGNASRFSYLSLRTGSIDAQRVAELSDALHAMPSVLVETSAEAERAFLVVVTLKRDQPALDEILERFEWHDVHLSDDADGLAERVSGDFEQRISEAEHRLSELGEALRTTVTDRAEQLVALWSKLRLLELYARVQSSFSRTRRTVLFSGWLPEGKRKEIEARIERACSERCYIEWRRPLRSEQVGVPVQLDNPRFLAPFELLVRNYSMPAYGSIDPTPLVAISYLTMFGLMFGDVGQGVVLMLCGIVGRALHRGKGNVRDLLTLLVWCGAAAVVAGVLFGSYFGMQWFPPLWFDYHAVVAGHEGGRLVGNIYDVLAITVYFGVSVIGLGLVLNWINLIERRRWFELMFDKAGVFGGIIFAGGVWAAAYFVAHEYRQLPDPRLLGIILGVPSLIFGFKAPVEYLRLKREGAARPLHPLSFVDFAMEWIVELLEIFSGYLANTLSFMRVAGLGIAHEALMIAFFDIARMTSGGPSGALGITILVFGNLLVIVLEGLSAGIQSLRLNYYEFFSKYFVGAGRAYSPVSLRTSQAS